MICPWTKVTTVEYPAPSVKKESVEFGKCDTNCALFVSRSNHTNGFCLRAYKMANDPNPIVYQTEKIK